MLWHVVTLLPFFIIYILCSQEPSHTRTTWYMYIHVYYQKIFATDLAPTQSSLSSTSSKACIGPCVPSLRTHTALATLFHKVSGPSFGALSTTNLYTLTYDMYTEPSVRTTLPLWPFPQGFLSSPCGSFNHKKYLDIDYVTTASSSTKHTEPCVPYVRANTPVDPDLWRKYACSMTLYRICVYIRADSCYSTSGVWLHACWRTVLTLEVISAVSYLGTQGNSSRHPAWLSAI